MGSSLNRVDNCFPTQSVLLLEWKSNISQWIKDVQSDIDIRATRRANDVFSDERIGELLNEDDSGQKVFDVYGVSKLYELLGEHDRAKDLLIELTKIVPYAAIDVDIADFCAIAGRMPERVRFMERAFQKEPENAVVWNYLGSALMSVNEKKRGLELLGRSSEKRPGNKMVFSNYLNLSHWSDEFDCNKLFQEHKRWARHNAAKELAMSGHGNIADPNRRLRVGYISPDFRKHPLWLFEPFARRRNMSGLEVYCYGNSDVRDLFFKPDKRISHHFREIADVDCSEVAKMILKDKIDILVDLAGHGWENWLGVLAYKPAPIQVTYSSYNDTTGMEQVDYFLTDGHMSPPETQQYHTEKLFPLEHTSFCYSVPDYLPRVVASPVIENGYVTFGMFDGPAKITPEMAVLWAKIMGNSKGSRLKLILKSSHYDEMAPLYLRLLENAGVPRGQVDISEPMTHAEYLGEYGKVDIVLDTYPRNGGMTTCDALWMGVPVVSLVGEHHLSRIGLSLLASTGLEYFACKTADEYVAKASVFATKPEALATMRGTMRQRIQGSAACDMHVQAQSLERAYREMWHRWCRK